MMDKVRISYRSDKMLRVLWPARDAGIWQDHGLDITWSDCCSVPECPRSIVRGLPRPEQGDQLVGKLLNNELDIICGLHFEPYYRRFHTANDEVVFFGQAVSRFPVRVVAKDPSIQGLNDLHGKRVGVSQGTPEFSQNVPAYLFQNGIEVDRDDVMLCLLAASEVIAKTLSGELDAGLITPPYAPAAKAQGLAVIDVPDFPVIYGISPLATTSFLGSHPDLARRFLKGLADAILFYKDEKSKVLNGIRSYFEYIYPAEAAAGTNGDDAFLDATYEEERIILDETLLPDPIAIGNVYQLTARLSSQDDVVANPLRAWELRYIREALPT